MLRNQQDGSYQVFTPFYRAWRDHGADAPFGRPYELEWIGLRSAGLPAYDEIAGAGETAARGRWTRYRHRPSAYAEERDRPDLDGTSRMSVPLRYGELHPRTLLADLAQERSRGGLRRLARRRTGFPIVDAGMRQLAGEGRVHNRVRMLVASFLVKDLHVHWRYGARWFMRRLRDGDLASNSLNWQWVAGCGADAAPYLRIFNPVTQGLTFDPDGDYVRRWVPELRTLSGPAAHEPWKHGGADGYPGPVTDHTEARREALRRYAEIR